MSINSKLHLVFLTPTSNPDISYKYPSYGIIGTPTGLSDVNGEDIYVGDLVKATKFNGWWTSLVITCNDDSQPYFTINGIASHKLEDLIFERKVEKVMSHKCLSLEFRRHINFISLSEQYVDLDY